MQFITLSQFFYQVHQNDKEILTKDSRPYVCLGIRIDGIPFAIPIRHHIHHKYMFPTIGDAGLDYTKAVVISGNQDIGKTNVQIDQSEWNIIKVNEDKIEREFSKYLKLYRKAMNYRTNPHYANILNNSALQYFESYF